MKIKNLTSIVLVLLVVASSSLIAQQSFKYTTKIPDEILTLDKVKTSIGELSFIDGVPSRDTTDKVCDFMDTSRAADAFLKGMPAASLAALIEGAHSLGAVKHNQVMIFDELINA